MKRIFTLFLIFTAFFLVSCTKYTKDEFDCFISVEQAKANAQKNKQEILLVVTTGTDDPLSEFFITSVLGTDTFKSTIAKNYTVLHMDFSEESYKKTVVNPEADKKTREANEKYADFMFENARIASMLNVRATPAVFIFTNDLYCITEVELEDDVNSPSELEILLTKCQPKVENVEAMINATKNGSSVEKVQAIDSLFENTPDTYKVFLSDLYAKVIELDKNNESGLLSKYLLANANAVSSSKFIEGKVNEAVDEFINICDNPSLSPDDKQQSYYMAAYVLAMSGNTEFARIVDYLQKAIDANPDSETVDGIVAFKSYVEAAMQQGN